MKKLLSSLICIGFATLAMAQPPVGDAKPGETYGEKINASDALSFADVVKKVKGGNDFTNVKFTAKITDVCPKKRLLAKTGSSPGRRCDGEDEGLCVLPSRCCQG